MSLSLPDPPWIVGHRGAAGVAPENTLESVGWALEQAVDMVEVDVQLTRDGALVCAHDWNLRRVAGRSAVVERLPLAALRELDVGGGRRPGAAASRVPTLAEVLDTVPADRPLNLELKRRRAPPGRFVETLAGAIEGRRQILISSFDWDLLARIRKRLPDRPLAPNGKRWSRHLLAAADRLGAWSVHCHRRLAFPSLIAAASGAGRPVLVFTVNDVRLARRFLAAGVSGLFTDYPGRLRRELEAWR